MNCETENSLEKEQTLNEFGEKCFLCNRVFVKEENAWLLHPRQASKNRSAQITILKTVSLILGRNLEEAETKSLMHCLDCNVKVLELAQAKQRYIDTQKEIFVNYLLTSQLQDAKSYENIEEYLVLNAVEILNSLFEYTEDHTLTQPVDDAVSTEEIPVNSTQNFDFTTGSNLNCNDIIECDESKPEDEDGDTFNENNSNNTPAAEVVEDQPSLQLTYRIDGEFYVCLSCNDSQQLDITSFTSHMLTFHNTKLFCCDVCKFCFTQKDEFDDHVTNLRCIALQSNRFTCKICNESFENSALLRKHRHKHYKAKKTHQCDKCPKMFHSEYLLLEHMNTHSGERPFKCTECPKSFASKYTLTSHLKIHSQRQRPFQCSQCNKSFLNRFNLSHHEKLHTAVKSYSCEICSKAFVSQYNLDAHLVVHSDHRPFICRTCGKSFARSAEIRDHERIHTGEKPFSCDICGMSFAQRSNLKTHKKSTHLNIKEHKCEVCGRNFKRRRLLDFHIQAAHTGERPLKCEQCGATFIYPEHFKKHSLTHLGRKDYTCGICNKEFVSSDNRNCHLFVHTDKKPYECAECGQGFMRKPYLIKHFERENHKHNTIIINKPRVINESVKFDVDIVLYNAKENKDTMQYNIEEDDENVQYNTEEEEEDDINQYNAKEEEGTIQCNAEDDENNTQYNTEEDDNTIQYNAREEDDAIQYNPEGEDERYMEELSFSFNSKGVWKES